MSFALRAANVASAVTSEQPVSKAEASGADLQRDDAVAALCHSLRTPLTSSLGFLQLSLREARRTAEESALTRNLELADQQLRRLAAMIDDFSRQAGGRS